MKFRRITFLAITVLGSFISSVISRAAETEDRKKLLYRASTPEFLGLTGGCRPFFSTF